MAAVGPPEDIVGTKDVGGEDLEQTLRRLGNGIDRSISSPAYLYALFLYLLAWEPA